MEVIIFNKPGRKTYTARYAVGTSLKKLQKELKEQGIVYTVLDSSELPKREFRMDHEFCPKRKQISLNKDRATKEFIKVLREVRDLALKALDVEQLRNLTNPEKLKDIEDRKQQLRDLTKKYNKDNINFNNPKESWPAELKIHYRYDN